MFGKYFKHVLVLTALAWLTYTLPSVRAALETGYVDGSGNMPAATISAVKAIASTSTSSKEYGNRYGVMPSVKMYVGASQYASDSKLNVNNGDTLYFYGTPENIKGLTYGKDYTAAFFFPEKLLSCKNNNIGVNPTWIMVCTANGSGEGKMYMQIYRGGKTFTSNVIRVSAGSVAASSIKVSSPNGGEVFGSSDSIKFVGMINYTPKQLVAYLYSPINGNVATQYLSSVSQTGLFVGHFSGDPGIGAGQYKITVCDLTVSSTFAPGKPLCDSSDNYFEVKDSVAPTITVNFPQQGDVYDNGPTQNINVGWTGKDIVADYYSVSLFNTFAGAGMSIGADKVSIQSNGATFQPTEQLINGILANSNGATREQIQDSYYVVVTAAKELENGIGLVVATAQSGLFSIIPQVGTSAEVSFVGASEVVMSGDNANDDVGTFKIKTKVTAVGGDVYVPRRPGSTGFQYLVDKMGVVAISPYIVATVSDVTDNSLTTGGNLLIEEGETHTIDLVVSVPMGNGLTAGQYKLSLTGVAWDSVDAVTPSKSSKTDTNVFKTNYVSLN